MVLIGLTGGIASGKSTVSKMLAALGAKIIDADVAARDVVLPGSSLLRELTSCFGEEILMPDRSLNRAWLGEKVFNDESSRQKLNALMHPAIRREILRQIDENKRQGEAWVFLDIPLLFETDWHKCTQANWVVYVDAARQVERLMARNHLSQAQALARVHSQMPLADKVKLADVAIDNNGDLRDTECQVAEAWNKLRNSRIK